MAPVYADHPFPTLNTPIFLAKQENEKAQVCLWSYYPPVPN